MAAAYRVSLAETAERLVIQDRLRPAFLFGECRVETLDEAALHFRGNRVIERFSQADMLGLLIQVGAVPASA